MTERPAARGETAAGLRDTEKDATETQRHREFLRFFSVPLCLCGQFLCASQALDFGHGLLASIFPASRQHPNPHIEKIRDCLLQRTNLCL